MPEGFVTSYRNPGHWDISTYEHGRAFRIRGEPGDVRVYDERRHPDGRFMSSSDLKFPSVAAALSFCAFQLMFEEGHP